MNLDITIFSFFHQFVGKSVCLDSLFIFFAKDFIWILAILTLGIYLFFYRRQKLSGKFFLGFGTFVLSYVVLLLIQYVYFRLRPFVALKFNPLIDISASNPSFPSFHSILAFILAFFIFSFNKRWGIVFFIFATFVSLARVFVGVHWFSDILAGFFIVLISFYIIRSFLKNINL
jgi:undecaprenyl-diphosphatase